MEGKGLFVLLFPFVSMLHMAEESCWKIGQISVIVPMTSMRHEDVKAVIKKEGGSIRLYDFLCVCSYSDICKPNSMILYFFLNIQPLRATNYTSEF